METHPAETAAHGRTESADCASTAAHPYRLTVTTDATADNATRINRIGTPATERAASPLQPSAAEPTRRAFGGDVKGEARGRSR